MALRIILIVLLGACTLLVAHLFRYSPMPGGETLKYSLLWDRWLQRVCVVSFVGDNKVNCSMETFATQFSKSSEEARQMSPIEEALKDGYTADEIDTFLRGLRQAKDSKYSVEEIDRFIEENNSRRR